MKGLFSKEVKEEETGKILCKFNRSGRKRSSSFGGLSRKNEKEGEFTIREQIIERQSWFQVEV